MRWPTDARTLTIGPGGLSVDGGQHVPAPLTPAGLPAALRSVPAAAASRWRIVVADEWTRALLVELPAGVRRADEVDAFVTHRLREIHDAEIAAWPRVFLPRRQRPWSRWPELSERSARWRLVAALRPEVADALTAWRHASRLRLTAIDSAWGDALARLPRTPQGVLAVLDGHRLTVGAWSAGAWLGWRSFVAGDAVVAQAAARRWLTTFPWQGRVVLWQRGLPLASPASPWPPGWQVQEVPAAPRPGGGTFDFRRCLARTAWPWRRKVLVFASLLTLLATLLVSLPDDSTPPDEAQIVGVRPRSRINETAPQPPEPTSEVIPASPASESALAAVSPLPAKANEVAWPLILGVFEARGQRKLLLSTDRADTSAGAGAVIQRRFHVGSIGQHSVLITDLVTMEKRKFPLQPSGTRP
ncbi:MAG TPA: hypothetical protein PLF25_03140 [Accumulibacter sp.]|nr:hypothetical protein [Accumulibacter sp.]